MTVGVMSWSGLHEWNGWVGKEEGRLAWWWYQGKKEKVRQTQRNAHTEKLT